MFIGRKQELKFLEDRYKARGGQLVVLYGRRRIGKTETLKEFCKDKEHIFFSCRECTDMLQLKSFSDKMFREKIPAAQYLSQCPDWEQAFKSIAELPFKGKKLVVIDEFPYMCKGNPSIPSIIQNLWDESLKDQDIMIILCGSSMSFIEKELLSEKNPLYGRATGIYKMVEMDFYDAMKFLPDYTDKDKVMAYSVLGGIPHYLKQFDPDISISDNIKSNLLTKGCALYSEVEFLLRQELRETNVYNSIIEAVALGNTRLNDIKTKSLIEDMSKTSVYLKKLVELGLVKREFPVDSGIKEQANANRGIYTLTDNFFRFWYSFVFTNYSELESGDVDGVYQYAVEPRLHQFASLPFEEICRQYMSRMNRTDSLPFRYSRSGRWWGKTTVRRKDKTEKTETEIDLLASDANSGKYIIGECKFKSRPFSFSEYLDVTAKFGDVKANTEIWYYLFSESGFDDKLSALSEGNDKVRLIPIDIIVNVD